MKDIRKFIKKILNRPERVISIILIGSRITRYKLEQSSDTDIVVIIDDTLLKEKENIKEDIIKEALNISNNIHCQVFFLTKFWKYIEEGSPITYHIIKYGKIVFDIGFSSTLKSLIKKGVIKPKREAVEKQLAIAKQLIKITYHSVNKGLLRNLEGAVVSSAQSVMIELGIEPPSPKEVPEYIKKVLVDRGLLDEKYYYISKEIIQTYKAIEHKKRDSISGNELQEMYNKTNDFVNKMDEIINKIRLEKNENL